MKKSNRKPEWALILPIASLVLMLILEGLNRHDLIGGFRYALESPFLFLFNALLVLDSLFICLFFRRRLFVFLTTCMLWLTCGIINCLMVSYRTLPFTVIDLTLLRDALGLFDVYFNLPQRILIVSAGVAAVIAVIVLFFLALKGRRMRLSHLMGGAAVLAALTASSLSLSMDASLISPSLNDLTSAYRQYGFPYCFLTTFVDVGVDAPEDYSDEAIEAVEEQIDSAPMSAPSYLVRPNVVFVQLESFFDPALVKALRMQDNPIPTFTRLRNDWPSGYLTMPAIGGGTANSEFEILTGMALQHFGAGEYPYNTVMMETSVESICYNLDGMNYTSHAIHNHSGSFYNRNLVYPNMGFDTFTSLEYMNDYAVNSLGWAEDSVLTGEILRAIDSTDGKDFVFCVSVQSHGHYPTEQVSENTVIAEYPAEESDYWSMDYYLQEIRKVDAFIADLTAALKASDEPTLLVLYGDHLPSLGLAEEDLLTGSIYKTEYIIWNNHSGLLQHIADRDLNAYQLSAYVLDLLKVRNGSIARLHQAYLQEDEPDSAAYMDSLQLIEYDMLYGENNLHDGANPYLPSHMRMGIAPIGITQLHTSDGALILRGTGFTDHSEVFFADEQIPTIFVSPTLLVATELPEDGAPVSVQQISPDDIVLSISNSMILPYEKAE